MAEEQISDKIDFEKAVGPPRAIDVYLIASRLKRMMLALADAHLYGLENNRAGGIEALKTFSEVSQSIEPLLDNLVMKEGASDAEAAP